MFLIIQAFLFVCLSSSLLSLLSFRGQTPAQAEINYLNKAKWLEMYGVDMHMVKVTYTHFFSLACRPTVYPESEMSFTKDRKWKECA